MTALFHATHLICAEYYTSPTRLTQTSTVRDATFRLATTLIVTVVGLAAGFLSPGE